jgi:hypothetical protein
MLGRLICLLSLLPLTSILLGFAMLPLLLLHCCCSTAPQ